LVDTPEIRERVRHILPDLAPLSASHIDRLVEVRLGFDRETLSVAQVERIVMQVDAERSRLREEIPAVRASIYTTLDLESPEIATGVALEHCQQYGLFRSSQSLQVQAQRGVVRRVRHGLYDAHSFAALLIAYHLRGKPHKRWTPARIREDEPLMWLWCQTEPDGHPEPVPNTQVADLPTHALLWTPWCGMLWDEGWQEVEGVGVARLAGGPTEAAQAVWGLAAGEEIVGLVQRKAQGARYE